MPRWFTSSTPPEPHQDATLTPLAPRLFTSTPSSPSQSPPRSTSSRFTRGGRRNSNASSTTVAAGGADDPAWGAGGFAGLMSGGDPRLSVSVCDGGDEQEGREEGAGRDARRDSLLALPGARVGVAGKDAALLVQELHRARLAAIQKKRRRLATVAGVLTLLVAFVDGWYFIEFICALSTNGGQGRGVIRWIALGVGLFSLVAFLAILPWLRSRRPNIYSIVVLVLALTTTVVHLVAAIGNIALAILWREELSRRCTWGIDVGWTLGRQGDDCGPGSWTGWVVAAAIRLLVTVIVAALWIYSLRRFHRCLRVTSIVDPELAPSSEAQSILARHSATIVPLSDHAHPRLGHSDNYLPPMPDRAAHYRLFWGAVGWMMGVPSYDAAREVEEGGPAVEKGEKHAMLLREGRGSDGMPGQRSSFVAPPDRVYSPRHLDEPDQDGRYLPSAKTFETASGSTQSYPNLFNDVGLRRPRSNSQQSQTTPLLRPISRIASSTSSLRSRSSSPPPRSTSPPLPPTPPPPPPKSQTGSSGSTGGSLVFVRMSDGRLVRKLSTIASEASGEGGTRSGSSVAQTSESLSTAPENYVGPMDVEVELLDGVEEIVDEWRADIR